MNFSDSNHYFRHSKRKEGLERTNFRRVMHDIITLFVSTRVILVCQSAVCCIDTLKANTLPGLQELQAT